MEVDEIHKQVCKVSRISYDSNNKLGKNGGTGGEHPYREDKEERCGGGGGGDQLGTWRTSRIFRVSRASGGKDRHSKVLTAKGLRDRRVRLSVSTAIQFYDVQDRLGYDQPSKAVEWLINAAADAITELPSLDTNFPQPIQQRSEERDEEEVELLEEADTQHHQQQQLSRSACSSTSETSKGGGGSSSVLSLSRTESRVKARERARERAAKDKMKDENESHIPYHHHNSQQSSFTELLTGGCAGGGGARQHFPSTTSMDYFSSGLYAQRNHFSAGGFSGQNQHLAMPAPHPFSITSGDHHPHHQPEMQQFSFLPDHMIPEAAEAVTGSDYNLNFSISSGLAGYNRGTLQSNSPSSLPHSNLQRFSSHVEGTNIPFFIGNVAAAPSSAAPSNETHFQAGFDAHLQLRNGDRSSSRRHSNLKGKGKT